MKIKKTSHSSLFINFSMKWNMCKKKVVYEKLKTTPRSFGSFRDRRFENIQNIVSRISLHVKIIKNGQCIKNANTIHMIHVHNMQLCNRAKVNSILICYKMCDYKMTVGRSGEFKVKDGFLHGYV